MFTTQRPDMTPEPQVTKVGILTKLKHSFKVVGAMVVLLLATIGLFTILYFLFFRQSPHPNGSITAHAADNHGAEGDTNLCFSLPGKVFGSSNYLSPVTIEGSYADRGIKSSSGASTIVNVAMANFEDSQLRLVFDKRVVVKRVDYPARQSDSTQKMILFEVLPIDSNHDGMIDGNDNTVLFFSDLDGKNLTQMTPDSVTVTGWSFVSDKNRLAITVVEQPMGGAFEKGSKPEHLCGYDFSTRKFSRLLLQSPQ